MPFEDGEIVVFVFCSKHVLTEDVVERFVDKNGNLWSKRLLSKTNGVPKWAEKIVSSRVVFIIEESILDPINKVFITYTRNVGMRSLMTIEEKVTYRKSSDNSNWTLEERHAAIDSSMSFGLSRAVQSFGVERFKQNISKTYKGFHMVLEKMYSNFEGKTETTPNFHPFLTKSFKEKALILKEAAKFKAVPIVSAASREEQK